MFLSGTLEDFSPTDVLQLLSFSMKTGALRFEGTPSGTVWFHEGELYYAETRPGLSIESYLAARGALSRGQWDDAVRRAGGGVGAELVGSSMVNRDELRTGLYSLICKTLLDFLRMTTGTFEFEEDLAHPIGPVTSFKVDAVVGDVRSRLDEADAIARAVPSADLWVALAAKAPEGMVEVRLTPPEWEVLAAVGPGRTVADLARTLGRGQFAVMRVLHKLLDRRLAVLTPEAPESAAPSAPVLPPAPVLEAFAAELGGEEPTEDPAEDVAPVTIDPPAPEPVVALEPPPPPPPPPPTPLVGPVSTGADRMAMSGMLRSIYDDDVSPGLSTAAAAATEERPEGPASVTAGRTRQARRPVRPPPVVEPPVVKPGALKRLIAAVRKL